MEQKSVGLLLTVFFMLILGAGLLGVIASSTQEITTKTIASGEEIDVSILRSVGGDIEENQSIEVTHEPSGWKLDSCPLTSVTLLSSEDITMVDATDYEINETYGTFTLINTTVTVAGGAANTTFGNTTTITYSYCGDDYLNASWQRSVLNTVVGFFALILLIIAVGLFYKVMKDEGLINI